MYRHFQICILLLCSVFPVSVNAQPITKLDASDTHQLRNGLQNCKLRFENDKHGKVAFLGGSITYNPGWRDSVCAYLEKRFPDTEFEFISAGIPSMGSMPAAFRLERDVLSNGRYPSAPMPRGRIISFLM